jgi:hypothetical protein
MVAIFGPSCPSKVTPKAGTEIVFPTLEPLMVDAKTLAEALAAYGHQYGVRFRAYDGSDPAVPFEDDEPAKYFFYEKADGTSYLVDIHIERGKEEICPRQDLSVWLEPSDRVNIGPLAC